MDFKAYHQKFNDFAMNDAVQQCRFEETEILMWPLVKWQVYLAIWNDSLEEQIGSETSTKKNSGASKVGYSLKTILNRPKSWPIKDTQTLFISGAQSYHKIEGQWISGLWDGFFRLLSQSGVVVMQTALQNQYRFSTHIKHVSLDYITLKAGLLSKIMGRVDKRDLETIQTFSGLIAQHFNLNEANLSVVQNTLRRFSEKLPFLKKEWKNILKKTQCKVLFLEDACYQQNSFLIKWSKEEGVKVVELQHGIIPENSPNYNQSEALCNHQEYTQYFPNYLLTWGTYWSDKISLPSSVIEIGNIKLAKERAARMNSKWKKKSRKKILVFYDDLLKSVLLEFSAQTRGGDYDIYLKFHPRQSLWNCPIEIEAEFRLFDHVYIEEKSNLYKALEDVDSVVGKCSTALLESAALGIPMFYHGEGLIDARFGTSFKTSEHLTELLTNHPLTPLSLADMESVFKSDWQDAFIRFCNEELSLKLNRIDEKSMIL